MKPGAMLTQNALDDVYEQLKADGAGMQFKIDRNAPRFDSVKKKLTLKRAQQIRADQIEESVRELVALLNRPLDTHEYAYVKRRKGSKAWKKRGADFFAPMICSKEVTEALLAPNPKSKRKC